MQNTYMYSIHVGYYMYTYMYIYNIIVRNIFNFAYTLYMYIKHKLNYF